MITFGGKKVAGRVGEKHPLSSNAAGKCCEGLVKTPRIGSSKATGKYRGLSVINTWDQRLKRCWETQRRVGKKTLGTGNLTAAGKCWEESVKTPGIGGPNAGGKRCEVSVKTPGIGSSNAAGKCHKGSVKTPGIDVSNTAGKCCKWLVKTPGSGSSNATG